MLVQLSISNFVLLESAVLDLGPGFNVLTGETGAGKSMLVEALGLVLGGRANPDHVRQGAPQAEVEALFQLPPGSPVAARLEAAGMLGPRRASEPLDGEDEVVVRRVVQPAARGGRSRAFVNGRLCTAAELADMARSLCDIASQHESVALTDASTHLEYLDAYAGASAERSRLSGEVERLGEIARDRDRARSLTTAHRERAELLGFQLQEIDEVDPSPGEEDELSRQREILRHASKLQDLTFGAASRLAGGAEGTRDGEGLVDAVLRVAGDVRTAAAIDPALAPTASAMEAACAELSEAARSLARHAETLEADPARLEQVEERLFRLSKLLRKHGPTTNDLLAHRARIAAELAAIDRAPAAMLELDLAFDRALAEASARAVALSATRVKAARRLGAAIQAELARLGMAGARVVMDVCQRSAEGADLVVSHGGRTARLSHDGIDRVEILIAPNKGEEPRPLRRIASGGELSRTLLALKRVVAGEGPATTFVLDEVDAGVGGAVAGVIGQAIRDLSRTRQVICITHLSQIAALAATHFVIAKAEVKGRTVSGVRRLGAKGSADRVAEIARMMAGSHVGPAARGAASELLRGG